MKKNQPLYTKCIIIDTYNLHLTNTASASAKISNVNYMKLYKSYRMYCTWNLHTNGSLDPTAFHPVDCKILVPQLRIPLISSVLLRCAVDHGTMKCRLYLEIINILQNIFEIRMFSHTAFMFINTVKKYFLLFRYS